MDKNTEEPAGNDVLKNESSSSPPREIVLPGDLLDEGTLQPGSGTYQIGSKIYSAHVGIKNISSNFVNVISLTGCYIPRVGDTVIGKVIELLPSSWILDIHSPYQAPLHTNEVPWRVEYGETKKYLDMGDTVLARIISVDEIKRIQATMRGPGLRKLNEGQVLEISPLKVPRVIGKSGSMINLLKNHTGCNLFVGQNGRIWIDGEIEKIRIASRAIHMIEANAHTSGLTDKIEEFLKGTEKEVE